MTSLHQLTISEAADLLQRKQITSAELTRAHLERIANLDPKVGAFVTVTPEIALQQAAEADDRRAKGESNPLLGVPLGIKDVLLTKGVRTTAASRILSQFIGPYDATVVARLRHAGVVCLGKLNCDEFAMGSSTENSGHWVTHNPWDLERTPGGSSGGSAAAVAARLCPAALGTDTGGSIRQPAAFCGIVGLKPSYGRVSRYGLIAYASSLDQIGPMARSTRDCAHLLKVMAGHDSRDSTSARRPVPDYAALLDGSIRGARIGIPREYFVEGMQPEVDRSVREAVDRLKEIGAQVTSVSLPHTEYAVPAYYLIATAEASSNLARYDGIRFGLREAGDQNLLEMYRRTRATGFGAEVKRRIMLGTYALSAGYYDAYYLKAQRVRTLVRRDFESAFGECDAIVTPTVPSTAFRLGEMIDDPLQMYLTDIFTTAINLAGLPALSLPCGVDTRGLPVGLQVVGRPFEEERVLQLAHAYESDGDWTKRAAPGFE